MIVASDVDLSLLKELHHYGSVQTLKDRRLGIYQLHFTEQDEARDAANEVLKEKKYNLITTIFYESDSNGL